MSFEGKVFRVFRSIFLVFLITLNFDDIADLDRFSFDSFFCSFSVRVFPSTSSSISKALKKARNEANVKENCRFLKGLLRGTLWEMF